MGLPYATVKQVEKIATEIVEKTGGGGSGDSYTKKEVDDLLKRKQDELISGLNIKTINTQSILGDGDIKIAGGDTYSFETLDNVDDPRVDYPIDLDLEDINLLELKPESFFLTDGSGNNKYLFHLVQLVGRSKDIPIYISYNDSSKNLFTLTQEEITGESENYIVTTVIKFL